MNGSTKSKRQRTEETSKQDNYQAAENAGDDIMDDSDQDAEQVVPQEQAQQDAFIELPNVVADNKSTKRLKNGRGAQSCLKNDVSVVTHERPRREIKKTSPFDNSDTMLNSTTSPVTQAITPSTESLQHPGTPALAGVAEPQEQ